MSDRRRSSDGRHRARATGGAGPGLVFGYGSLAVSLDFTPTREPSAGGWVADLAGHRRVWGVAMDNAAAIPGYKRYLDPETGEPPAVMVAFLDLAPSEDGAVNGVLTPVDARRLEALDQRERNYRRVEVTALIAPPPEARVWTYVGTAEARGRLRRGLVDRRAVIAGRYLELVKEGFRRLGDEEWLRYRASTEAAPCPVRELRRVRLGGRPGHARRPN